MKEVAKCQPAFVRKLCSRHFLQVARQKKNQSIYQMTILGFVLSIFCLSHFVTFVSVRNRQTVAKRTLILCDWILLVILTCEFAIRICFIDQNPMINGSNGRLRRILSWQCCTDMLVLSATFVLALSSHYPIESVENLRFLQLLRILQVDRRASAWRIMRRVVVLHRVELLTSLYICMIGMLCLATTVYHIENASSSNGSTISTYGDALYWSVTTAATIGYGDVMINNWWSKLLTSIFCFFLVSLTSIQSSILGVGLACMLQDDELRKKQKKQRPRAARLLQCWWRARLLFEKFDQISIYRYEMLQMLLAYEMSLSNSRTRGSLVETLKARLGTFSNLNTMLQKASQKFTSTEQRLKKLKSTNLPLFHAVFAKGMSWRLAEVRQEKSYVDLELNEGDIAKSCKSKRHSTDGLLDRTLGAISLDDASSCELNSTDTIGEYHKIFLRALWCWKFHSAKRKFKKTRQPYDLYDASLQLSESESIQLQEMNRLTSRLEMTFGKGSSNVSLNAATSADSELFSKLAELEGRVGLLNSVADSLLSQCQRMDRTMVAQSLRNRRCVDSEAQVNSS